MASSEKGLVQVNFKPVRIDGAKEGDPFDAVSQLERYFAGTLTKFDIPLDIDVSDFTRSVLDKTCDIPYGQTTSYGHIAKLLGKPKASRAVGGALNRNPVPIIVPCHRIVSAKSLTGYALGLEAKAYLLKLEGITLNF